MICLQETKVPDALFPAGAPAELGYPFAAWRGMKGYNGVAILSRMPFQPLDIAPDWCAQGDCRHLAVALEMHIRPGRAAQFLRARRRRCSGPGGEREIRPQARFRRRGDAPGSPPAPGSRGAVLVGDLNIAPLEHDVWSHKQLLDVVSHTPPETEGLTGWLGHGFHDAVRHFVPAERKLYTWWSYRNRDWRASDRGRRLDHVWVSRDLTDGLLSHTILKDARDWPQPSDHVPVVRRAGGV